jgi:clan AA aspartic protease
MGAIYVDIKLTSVDDIALYKRGYVKEDQVKSITTKAMVDSGAFMLAINENIKIQLDLRKVDEQMAELADGQKRKLEVCGPVEIRFENRRTTVDAIVLPGDSEVLLGVIPMEDMDVIIDPRKQKLVVNPESPYIAKKSLK